MHHEYSTYWGSLGCIEGQAELERAEALDPLNVTILVDRANLLSGAGRCDEAMARYRKAHELNPGIVFSGSLGLCYARQGRYGEALKVMQLALAEQGTMSLPDTITSLAVTSALAGRRLDAERWLDQLTQMSKRQYVPKVHFANVYAALSRKDEAFAIFDAAYAEHDSLLLTVKSDWRFDLLRGDPRFQELLRRIGLPE